MPAWPVRRHFDSAWSQDLAESTVPPEVGGRVENSCLVVTGEHTLVVGVGLDTFFYTNSIHRVTVRVRVGVRVRVRVIIGVRVGVIIGVRVGVIIR